MFTRSVSAKKTHKSTLPLQYFTFRGLHIVNRGCVSCLREDAMILINDHRFFKVRSVTKIDPRLEKENYYEFSSSEKSFHRKLSSHKL